MYPNLVTEADTNAVVAMMVVIGLSALAADWLVRRLHERLGFWPANVWVKVSGLPMTDWRWTVESLRPIVLETIEIFGADRAMVGSNFPVDGLYSDYDRLMSAYRTIIAGFTPDEQHRILHDNARRFYRL